MSFIWEIAPEDFSNTVKKSTCWADVSRAYYNRLSNNRTIKSRVRREKVSTAHFQGRFKFQGEKREGKYTNSKFKLEDLLSGQHIISNQRLKDRLIAEHVLMDQCYTCGLTDTWKGRPLSLHLVHINNNSKDNSIGNIIIQCPNCFSQIKHGRRKIIFLESCTDCGNSVPVGNKLCISCVRNKVPDKEWLKKELISYGFEKVQNRYMVDKETIIGWINSE